ncbi:MAG TPA: hypothetical protein VN739_09135, partial [Nitrososphaerales archaeon]|nr:hypothetical protein [Nitrososphaerales archaeon]
SRKNHCYFTTVGLPLVSLDLGLHPKVIGSSPLIDYAIFPCSARRCNSAYRRVRFKLCLIKTTDFELSS